MDKRALAIPSSSIVDGCTRSDRLKRALGGYMKRWEAFCSLRTSFTPWKADWNEEEIRARFETLRHERREIYYANPELYDKDYDLLVATEDYAQAPEIVQSGRYRCRNCVAFSYNLATSLYNASVIHLNGSHFLALEAPSACNLDAFFHLLDHYAITHLIRLTPAVENREERCFPYWEPLKEGTNEMRGSLAYYALDSWEDRQGFDVKPLLALIYDVMHSKKVDKRVMAVHCFGGVGRTGTLIAAFGLIEEMERQILEGRSVDEVEVSVEEVVWQLSIQRPYMVASSFQYQTLHEVVLEHLKHRR